VDDTIITSSSSSVVDELFSDLKSEFAIKDMGNLCYFLGIKVKKVSDGLLLNQEKYVVDILRRAGIASHKPAPTPISSSMMLSAHHGTPLGPEACIKYCSIVGALQYLSQTRPDLAFAFNKVCSISTGQSRFIGGQLNAFCVIFSPP
jgi:hypothetical protein